MDGINSLTRREQLYVQLVALGLIEPKDNFLNTAFVGLASKDSLRLSVEGWGWCSQHLKEIRVPISGPPSMRSLQALATRSKSPFYISTASKTQFIALYDEEAASYLILTEGNLRKTTENIFVE